jgi:hypothetical protein
MNAMLLRRGLSLIFFFPPLPPPSHPLVYTKIGPYLKPTANAFGPWYVVAKDPNKNIVYASNQYDEDVFTQSRSEFHVENLHWIAGRPPSIHLMNSSSSSSSSSMDDGGHYKLTMKIRHGPKQATGTLSILVDDEDNNTDERNLSKGGTGGGGGIVRLDKKDGGLAPGQYVVFYTDDGECLGGGIISERHWAKFLSTTSTKAKDDVYSTADKASSSSSSAAAAAGAVSSGIL